jgi:hypothetical protein
LFRFLSFGVLGLQRFVEVFELLNGPAPPNHAAKRTAQRNRDTVGAVCRNLSSNNPTTTAAATARTATA